MSVDFEGVVTVMRGLFSSSFVPDVVRERLVLYTSKSDFNRNKGIFYGISEYLMRRF